MRATMMAFAATFVVAPALACDLVSDGAPRLEDLLVAAKTAFFGTVVALRMSSGELTTNPPPECAERDPGASCWQGFWERWAAYHDNTVAAVVNVDEALRGTVTDRLFEIPPGEDNSCGERLSIGQRVLVVDGQVRNYAP